MLKRIIRRGLRRLGYDIRRFGPGQDAYHDIGQFISQERPVVFDVGANMGQTINDVRCALRDPVIHAFEPSATTFEALEATHGRTANVYLNNIGLGSSTGTLQFQENAVATMSSFRNPGPDGWFGKIQQTLPVDVSTVDAYCAQRGIASIDLLKIDTQGFELEVLRGAQRMLPMTHLVYLEVMFSEMYEGAPRYCEIIEFLASRGFNLCAFYLLQVRNGRAGWADALFTSRNNAHNSLPMQPLSPRSR